jgi:small nuclear ribonucleoprotein (snRNP)-like protein
MSAEAEAAPAAPAAGAAGDGRAAVRKDVLDLTKYVGQSVRVKMLGGREVQGELRGYDPLVNLVLDECVEYLRGEREACMQVLLSC